MTKSQRMALGRGLSALVSTAPAVPLVPPPFPVNDLDDILVQKSAAPDATSLKDLGVTFLDIARLTANPHQPRQVFTDAEIQELSESIKTLGVLQPIVVRPLETGFQIVAGERRFRAAQLAQLAQVPVIIKELTDRESLEIGIVENVQRQNLNALEEAKAYQRLIDEFSLTAGEVAERVGKDRVTISNIVRILRLPPAVQEMVSDGRISLGHAKAILTVKEPSAQINLATKVVSESLSVRALEAIVSRSVVLAPPKKTSIEKVASPQQSPHPDLEDRLRNTLGTKVSVHRVKQGGSIELHFYSDAELDRLVDYLTSERGTSL